MDKKPTVHRFINSLFLPLLLWILFLVVFYGAYSVYAPKDMVIMSGSLAGFVQSYAFYAPAVLGVLAIVVSYLLVGIIRLVRLGFWFVHLLVYLIVYVTLLWVGIQLQYYEPRFTEIAVYIIDYYAFSLMLASGAAIVMSVIACFITKKSS